ncbi:MAG: hypothetical protein KC636_09175, partial [Myxococcales bacterium]|nr:hypothetical protein [Myxococcales bacterium]
TDLAYRIDHDVSDLFVEAGPEPYPWLYSPATILPCEPVTLTDLRKLALDVDGVRNAWIEPLQASEPAVFYHEGRRELSLQAVDESAVALELRGLYRVLIERSEMSIRTGSMVERDVVARLHAHRGLCEDFAEVVVLDPEDIRVHAHVEIAAVEDGPAILAELYQRISDALSPRVRFSTLAALLAAGRPIDEIFEGPRLTHGFLDDEELRALPRTTTIYASDLIHELMKTPGVRAVRELSISSSGGVRQPWALTLGTSRAPRLVLTGLDGALTVALVREGLTISVDEAAVIGAYNTWLIRQDQATAPPPAQRDLQPTPGEDREVDRYLSIQHQLPATYGVGAVGLPDSASPLRKAQARQLRAYLTFFDQLLASYFSQLARARALFSFSTDARATYFAQTLADPTLGLEELWRGGEMTTARLERMIADAAPAGDDARRKHRLLNHLLARFAEQFTDYSLLLYGALREEQPAAATVRERLIDDKLALLRAYPQISAARGRGTNLLLPPGPENAAGLERRLALKLGLRAEDGEALALIEHILLRPRPADREQPGADQGERVPLLSAARYRDPYSLQLSVVLPEWPTRLRDPAFRGFVEQTIREETPAHLTAYVHWVSEERWRQLTAALRRWLELRRAAVGVRSGRG